MAEVSDITSPSHGIIPQKASIHIPLAAPSNISSILESSDRLLPMIALLTDFGNQDWYTASMKGTIAQIAPTATLTDISHEIGPGNIESAAFVLSQCFDDFPQGTVFLVVVDPGVGSSRKSIALESGGYFFVGPDNGVFSLCLAAPFQCIEIDTTSLPGNLKTSQTFHGRDIFAPAAAAIESGTQLQTLGEPLADIVRLSIRFASTAALPAQGQILHIDSFGNAITNLRQASNTTNIKAANLPSDLCIPFGKTFASVPIGTPTAYLGSGGFVEIGINQGNASIEFDLKIGDSIELV